MFRCNLARQTMASWRNDFLTDCNIMIARMRKNRDVRATSSIVHCTFRYRTVQNNKVSLNWFYFHSYFCHTAIRENLNKVWIFAFCLVLTRWVSRVRLDPKIPPDCFCKNCLDSGMRITLHEAKVLMSRLNFSCYLFTTNLIFTNLHEKSEVGEMIASTNDLVIIWFLQWTSFCWPIAVNFRPKTYGESKDSVLEPVTFGHCIVFL